MDLFFLREIHRICPQDCGPGPPASAHGSTGFIKRRSLATGSTARIKPSEPLSRLLISAVHHQSDGWGGWLQTGAGWARAHGGAPRLTLMGSQRRGELNWANLNRRRAATESDNGEAARPVLGDSEGNLR
jgi:hypothetical protein